jgi:hypothetical protein
MQSRHQARSRSGTISCQQSVQHDTPDDGLIYPHPPLHSTACIDTPRRQSTQCGGTPVNLRSHNVFPDNRKQFAVPSTTHRPSHDFHSWQSLSDNLTLRGSHSHLPSHARMLYEPPPNSTHSHLLAPPPDLSPPRQGTKRRNVEWSDDNGAGFEPGLCFHHIGS